MRITVLVRQLFNFKSTVALITGVLFVGLLSLSPASAATTTKMSATNALASSSSTALAADKFCGNSSGYDIWCNQDQNLKVKRIFWNSSGQFCARVQNTYDVHKSAAMDFGKNRGGLHKIRAHKARTICRPAPTGSFRMSLRGRVDRLTFRPLGTWLAAKKASDRPVTARRMRATQSKQSIGICARNPLPRKARLSQYWIGASKPVASSAFVRAGKIGCAYVKLGAGGFVRVMFTWNNADTERRFESWPGFGY